MEFFKYNFLGWHPYEYFPNFCFIDRAYSHSFDFCMVRPILAIGDILHRIQSMHLFADATLHLYQKYAIFTPTEAYHSHEFCELLTQIRR